ncbi:MAG: tRNA dihydrouridine synthase DusB [Rhodocyclaceae bacterium]|nr:tRNA dihydrouridine synthase DusB [Rhodocyclaceae bacterium]
MKLAGFDLRNNVFLAPMAGVTDRPFRQVARRMGAGLAVSEMVTSNALLYATEKTRRRTDHSGECGPISVQIAGAAPQMMADAARHNVARGADIIDINMGCPAKKVCNVAAGSALMRDERLVREILEAVVTAVPDTPVTLKCRTGWDRDSRNVLTIARIAEATGIRALTIHGRTREDRYTGEAEYDSIAIVKQAVGIPVIANGDIDSAPKARYVLDRTGADAVMVGRAAQGRPWIFAEIEHYLATGERMPAPSAERVHRTCRDHVEDIHAFYGGPAGVRIARKHIGWYVRGIAGAHQFRQHMVLLEHPAEQLDALDHFFHELRQPASWDHETPILAEELAA